MVKTLSIMKRCPIEGCYQRVAVQDMESHLYGHYNFCKYGHYEEFELFDPNWPKCKNEG